MNDVDLRSGGLYGHLRQFVVILIPDLEFLVIIVDHDLIFGPVGPGPDSPIHDDSVIASLPTSMFFLVTLI